jgi:hypothetical protein
MEKTDPDRALVEYAGLGDTAAVERLLAQGVDPDVVVYFASHIETIPETALHAAAGNGRADTARALLKGGADPDKSLGDGWTPAMLAAQSNHAGVLAVLAEFKADLDKRDDDNKETALHKAAACGHKEAAEALVLGGADRAAADGSGLRPPQVICNKSVLPAAEKRQRHKEMLEIFFQAEQRLRRAREAFAAAQEEAARRIENVATLQRDVTVQKPLKIRRKPSR